MRFLLFFMTSMMVLFALAQGDVLAQPSPDEYRRWCHEQELNINSHFSLPPKLISTQLGSLRAIISFHLLPSGQVSDLKPIRTSRADKAVITIPEKEFAEIERAMIDAVRKSAPLPLPKTESHGKGTNTVKYIFEPSNVSVTRVFLVAQ
jgi:hypothetical protein